MKLFLSTTTLAVLIALDLASSTSTLHAAAMASFVASGDPGGSPDANSQTVDAWTTVLSATGGRGSGFFNPGFGGPNPWVLFSFPSGGVNGSIQANHTFEGGPLSVGDTVTMSWGNSASATGTSVGLSLMNGSTRTVTVRWLGDNPVNTYLYDDAGGPAQPIGQEFQYRVLMPFVFRLTGAGTYSASLNGHAWSGMLAGPIDGIQVFNDGAGDGSDVGFNNLAVVPEPAAAVLAAVAGLCVTRRPRSMR